MPSGSTPSLGGPSASGGTGRSFGCRPPKSLRNSAVPNPRTEPVRPRITMTDNLTPRQIVAELDRYIVGQDAAKKAVAVAIRNRWRRQQLPPDLRTNVTPKNIILIGPTGVGKTEIARRLAQLVGAPFVKVEATKFTEVGYVGRDVESIIRDLTEAGIGLVKQEMRGRVREKAAERVTERLLDLLVPPAKSA